MKALSGPNPFCLLLIRISSSIMGAVCTVDTSRRSSSSVWNTTCATMSNRTGLASSAVDYLHSLGLAHNDIKPGNIMIREMPDGQPKPVLIDFGSCAPFGCGVFTMGISGWCKEDFTTSEKRHDIYSLGKVEEWLETAGSKEES
ncbi:hypothetical protein BJX66DRAFT_308368 [Aspergillus keveii]|uniref:Protein kinase domain-containing protein n=1 Tax=Aspergillus keveii TaxID=714993 RepID=A0ABR4FZL7_9EURO